MSEHENFSSPELLILEPKVHLTDVAWQTVRYKNLRL